MTETTTAPNAPTKPKTAQKLLVGFCLDETGSMGAILHQTIDGFNEYLADVQKQDGETTLSLTMFSDVMQSEPTFRDFAVATPIGEVPKLTIHSYRPRGNTPLFDAIGHTITQLQAWLDDTATTADEFSVLFVIQTDGHENASREFTRQQIFDLIREKEAAGWRFLYLGADQDAYEAERVGQAMGMQAGSTFAYSKATTDSAYSALAHTTAARRHDASLSSAQLAAQTKVAHDDEEAKKTRPPAPTSGSRRRSSTRSETPNF